MGRFAGSEYAGNRIVASVKQGGFVGEWDGLTAGLRPANFEKKREM
jgi:hypothetical protein